MSRKAETGNGPPERRLCLACGEPTFRFHPLIRSGLCTVRRWEAGQRIPGGDLAAAFLELLREVCES